MAGEWIKLETNLPTKPEVFKLARLINENVDTTVGLLCRFWCWADAVTVDGVVDAVVDADVDAVVKHSGFCASLIESGWLKRRPGAEGFVIPNFERHNGESAKKRALKSERQARWRAKSVDVSETQQRLHERLPEKRREEKKEKPSASAFVLPAWVPQAEWDAYVEMRAKRHPLTAYAKNLAVKDLAALKDQGHDPAAVLNWSTLNAYRGLFAPKGSQPKARDQFEGAL